MHGLVTLVRSRRWGYAGLVAVFGLLFSLTAWLRYRAFGFYSDDWFFLSNTVYLPATLIGYLKVNWYARPVYSFITWSLNQFADGSVERWQVISAFTVLANSTVAGLVISHLAGRLGYSRRASKIGGSYGAAALFFAPWMLAVFAWPTGVLTLWSFIFLGAGFLIIETREAKGAKLLGATLVACGFLAYEAYWFTFVPFLLAVNSWPLTRVRYAVCASLWYLVPLGMAVSYQRVFVPLIFPAPSKAISFDFSLMVNNIASLSRSVSSAISPVPSIALFLPIVAIALILLSSKAMSPSRMITIIAALALGFVITAAIHAAAGYGLTGTGIMSRSMSAPGLYFAVLVGLFAAASANSAAKRVSPPRSWALLLCFSIALAVLITGFFMRAAEWGANKRLSASVLSALLPAIDRNYLLGPVRDVSVVVQIEGDPDGELFGAYWELGGAVALGAPSLVPDESVWFMPARQGAWNTVWDGEAVRQRVCSAPPGSEVESRASKVPPLYYRIDPNSGKVLQSGHLTLGNEFGCGGAQPRLD